MKGSRDQRLTGGSGSFGGWGDCDCNRERIERVLEERERPWEADTESMEREQLGEEELHAEREKGQGEPLERETLDHLLSVFPHPLPYP